MNISKIYSIFSLLGGDVGDSAASATEDIVASAYDTFVKIVNVVLPIVIGVLLTLGIVLGIKVGIAFAKAEDEEAKKKAKNQLINILVGFIVAIVITAVIEIILNTSAIRTLFKVNSLAKSSS